MKRLWFFLGLVAAMLCIAVLKFIGWLVVYGLALGALMLMALWIFWRK